ncbi:WYL domain-containing protein [Psychrobacillus sp. FSL K6-2684]|uniref:WYL domain-containing protein n=1 Tax=unclassified Psychrobacillus TaxID=2636677 RepID=UPI0040406DAE
MEPLRLHYKFRNWYLYGYCRERKNNREFRISRMITFLSSKILDKLFNTVIKFSMSKEPIKLLSNL